MEAIFVRVALIWSMRAGGQVIRTTDEHPFYVQGKGWVKAAFLEAGQLLLSHDGRLTPIESIADTRSVETVYNMRVADYHTYFVGCQEWGFSVSAHNTYNDLHYELNRDSRWPGRDQAQANTNRAWALYRAKDRQAFNLFVKSLGVDPDVAWRAAGNELQNSFRGPEVTIPVPRNTDGTPLFNELLPTKPPLDKSHFERNSTTRAYSPNLPDGSYVYLQTEYGVIYVADNAPHAHPTILGRGAPAAAAGVLKITNGIVVLIDNDSGTFAMRPDTLANVRRAIVAYGGRVAADAVRPVVLPPGTRQRR